MPTEGRVAVPSLAGNARRVAGKYFLVSGGTQGAGESIALGLAEEGAAGVAICGRQEAKGAAVAAELEKRGAKALYVRTDLTEVADIENLLAKVDEAFPEGIDGLVNCAAVATRGDWYTCKAELCDWLYKLNMRAPFLLTQGAARIMRRHGRGGSIVNIGSVNCQGGQSNIPMYASTKGALVTMTKNASWALRNDHIRVNYIAVGWMFTPAENDLLIKEGWPTNWIENSDADQAFGRLLRPTDVSKMVTHLSSNDAIYQSGAIIDMHQNFGLCCWDGQPFSAPDDGVDLSKVHDQDALRARLLALESGAAAPAEAKAAAPKRRAATPSLAGSARRAAGKYFLVSGGTQGAGECIALGLAEEGAAGVAICGRQEAKGAAVAAELEKRGAKALFVRTDLTEVADIENLLAKVEEAFPEGIDGLVNCAAVATRGDWYTCKAELCDWLYKLNMRAPFLLTQGAARIMRRHGRGGSIVNIGSVNSQGGQSNIPMYASTKGALVTMTKNASWALRSEHIRVNYIAVGWMFTPAENDLLIKEGWPTNWIENSDADQAYGRLLRPTDVSKMVTHLMSDDAIYQSGGIIDMHQNFGLCCWDGQPFSAPTEEAAATPDAKELEQLRSQAQELKKLQARVLELEAKPKHADPEPARIP